MHPVAHGVDRMIDRIRRNGSTAQNHRHAMLQRFPAQDRVVGGRNGGEIGPDQPVEKVAFQRGDDFFGGVDRDRAGSLAQHRVGQQRQAGNMIEVAMGEEYVIDLDQIVYVERGCPGAGIEQDVLIDPQTGGQSFAAAYSAGTAQYL